MEEKSLIQQLQTAPKWAEFEEWYYSLYLNNGGNKQANDLGWKVFRCSFDIRNAKETEIEILNLKFKINDQDII